jgi:hypothetical protein
MQDASDENFDRVIAALRNLPVPEPPSFALPERTLSESLVKTETVKTRQVAARKHYPWIAFIAVAAALGLVVLSFRLLNKDNEDARSAADPPSPSERPAGLVSRSEIRFIDRTNIPRQMIASESLKELQSSLASLQRDFQRPSRYAGQERLERLVALFQSSR